MFASRVGFGEEIAHVSEQNQFGAISPCEKPTADSTEVSLEILQDINEQAISCFITSLDL